MGTQRDFVYRDPVSQLARPGASRYVSGLTQDPNSGSKESGQSQEGLRTNARVESKSTAAAQPRDTAKLGVRGASAEQHESIPFAGEEQGAQHKDTGPDAGPSAHPGQELQSWPIQRDDATTAAAKSTATAAEQRCAKHVRYVQSRASETGEAATAGLDVEPGAGQRPESLRGHGALR